MSNQKYSQRFRKDWLKEPEFKTWLMEVVGDSSIAYCKICKCNLKAKHSFLMRHMNTSKHKATLTACKSQTSLLSYASTSSSEIKSPEGKLCLYVATHCSISCVDHLGELCNEAFGHLNGFKSVKLHRTKCTQVINNILSPHFIHALQTDIGEKKFSLVLDESTDMSATKILGSAVRYFSERKQSIVVSFFGLEELADGSADSICSAIENMVEKQRLDMSNLMAIGTDNASVMVGTNNGVYTKLKQRIPNLQLIRCVCHSLQLSVAYVTREFLPRRLEFLIKETYNWFAHSPMRQAAYNQLYSHINFEKLPLKMLRVSQTRWLSIEAAITRIVDQWDELKTHFSIACSKEKCFTAEILYTNYEDDQNYLFLLFLKPVLCEVQAVNKMFQAESQDPTKLLGDLLVLIKSLCARILFPTTEIDPCCTELDKHLNPNPYLSYLFEKACKKSNLPSEAKVKIRERCVTFLKELIQQLRQRLPNNIKSLQMISAFSADECLDPMKPNIVPLSEAFSVDPVLIDSIVNQWQVLHQVKWSKVSDTVRLWSEIFAYKNSTGSNPFKEMADFAISILTLPHANADVERIFSYVNVVKCKPRISMSIKTLVSILNVKYGLKLAGKCCHNYELPTEVLNKIGSAVVYHQEFEVRKYSM